MWMVLCLVVIHQVSAPTQRLSNEEFTKMYEFSQKYHFLVPFSSEEVEQRINEVKNWDIGRFESKKNLDQAVLLQLLLKLKIMFAQAKMFREPQTRQKTQEASYLATSQKQEHSEEAMRKDKPSVVSIGFQQVSGQLAAPEHPITKPNIFTPSPAISSKERSPPEALFAKSKSFEVSPTLLPIPPKEYFSEGYKAQQSSIPEQLKQPLSEPLNPKIVPLSSVVQRPKNPVLQSTKSFVKPFETPHARRKYRVHEAYSEPESAAKGYAPEME